MFLLILLRRVPLRLHQKVSGRLELRRNPAAGWIFKQVHSTQLQRHKWDQRIHTLAGWRKSSRETCRKRKKKIQKKLIILNLSRGITSLFFKLMKTVGNHLKEKQQNPSLQRLRKFKTIKKRHWNTSLPYRHEQSLIRRSYGGFGRDCGHVGSIHECLSQSSSSSRKRPWREFEKCKEFFLENYRATFWRCRIIDQWSNRDYWYEPDWLQRIKVDIHQLVAQSSLSIRQCQSLRLFRLGAMHGENGKRFRRILEGQDSVVFKEQFLQRTESNWWKADGVRVEDFPSIHNSGYPQWDSENDGRITVWSSGFKGRTIFMSMFNDIVWEARGNEGLCENNSKGVAEYARQFFRGHFSFLEPGSEKKWYGSYDGIPSGYWTQTAEIMLLNFEKSGHPIFRCTSALEEGQLRSKDGGKTTIHFTACDENVHTVASENGYVRQSAQSLRRR